MSEQVIEAPGRQRDRLKKALPSDIPYALLLVFAALIVYFTLRSDVFFTSENFANIGRQTALVTIIAVGMALVIICAEIDLSVGSVLAISGMLAALAMRDISNSWILGAAVGISAGAFAGLINGILSSRVAIPSFLVTLGTLSIARGLSLLITDTQPVIIENDTYFTTFGQGNFIGIPVPIAWTIVFVLIGILVLHFTTFGRKVYATGGNVTAARYSGIKTNQVKTAAFVITGALAGFGALILTARSQAARPDFGAGLELDVIAAVILGGTSLFGGRGTILGVVLGSLLIGVLNNGLVLTGVSASLQLTIKGALIIAAVAFTRRSG
jgi:ribose transport system permease protein